MKPEGFSWSLDVLFLIQKCFNFDFCSTFLETKFGSGKDSGFCALNSEHWKMFITRRLGGSANCTVIPACDLLSGKKNTSPEKAIAAFASWGAVHGSNANYTRMALSLVDSYFRRVSAPAPEQPTPPNQAVKRPTPRLRTTPALRPASQSRLSPASEPRASKLRLAASRPSPSSPGVGPAAAATTPRGVSKAAVGPLAALAAEPPLRLLRRRLPLRRCNPAFCCFI